MRKKKSVHVEELCDSDLLSIYESKFAKMLMSQELLNRFYSVRMIFKWRPFKFMRLGNPRLPSDAATINGNT